LWSPVPGRHKACPYGKRGAAPTTERVHPTQIYEAIVLFVLTVVLVRFRARGMRNRAVFASYLIGAGVSRFLIELVRVNVPILFGLTTAQLFSAAAVALGVVLIVTRRESAPANEGSAAGRSAAQRRPGAKRKGRR
jgi:prolipoprotein diacylglyceryltransferase